MSAGKSDAARATGATPRVTPDASRRAVLYVLLRSDEDATALMDKLDVLRRERGYTPVARYLERADGAQRRPMLQRLLERARTRAFDVVIVACLDELGATRSAVFNVVSELKKCAVRVVSAAGGEIDPDDRALRWLAADTERHRKRIVAGIARNRRRGERTGEIPYGFRLADDGRSIILDGREQATMREARALRARGYSLRGTAAVLHRLGYRSRAGTPITHRQVSRWLGRDGP